VFGVLILLRVLERLRAARIIGNGTQGHVQNSNLIWSPDVSLYVFDIIFYVFDITS